MTTKKNNSLIIIVVIIALAALFFLPSLGLFTISNGNSLTRNIPSQVEPGESFTVTYQTANAPSGRWFVGWDESVVGGCTPTEVNDFMVSQTGGDKSSSSSFTAPPSGSCTFSGFYQYADGTQTNFPTRTVSVVECTTDADTNCDGQISFTELNDYAQQWVQGTVLFNDLIEAANIWVSD